MSEQQLIEELRSTLDETAAKLRLPSDAAAQARTLGRRRRAARGLLAVVPAAGLLAGFMIAAHASAPRPGSPAGTSAARAAHRPATQTVAYVTSHAEAALATVSHYIVKTTISGAPPPIYTWYDPVSKAGREVLKTRHDKMIDWSQRYGTGNGILIRFTYVDLGARTWSRGTVDGAAAQRIALRLPAPYPSPLTNPVQFRKELQRGAVIIVGRGPVNGHPAIELRLTHVNTDLVYWVDARTYQPLRIAAVGVRGALDIAWLPRTPVLVNQTNHPQIPAGFTRTPVR